MRKPVLAICLALSALAGCMSSPPESIGPAKPEITVWKAEVAVLMSTEKFLLDCPVNTALEITLNNEGKRLVAVVTSRGPTDLLTVRWCLQDKGCSEQIRVQDLMRKTHNAYLPDDPVRGLSPKNAWLMRTLFEQKPEEFESFLPFSSH